MGSGLRTGPEVECVTCGARFRSWHKAPLSRYCSRACAPQGRQPTLPDATCARCGVLFRPSNAKRPRHASYCSRPCYVAAQPRTTNGAGYVLVYRPEHPGAYPSGQVLEHRVVMEAHLGRYLLPDETVHHRNGVHDDNRLANLELWTSRHPKGQRVDDVVAWAREMLALYGEVVEA